MTGEDKALSDTRRKVKQYYERVGQLHLKPFDVPESPDEMELHVGWFFSRIRTIIETENFTGKFHDVNEVLVLLSIATGDLGMDITFSYLKSEGSWFLEFGNPEDYLNLPLLAKHFGLLWRFKWRGDALPEAGDYIDFDSFTVDEGNGDMFAYDRGGRD